MAHDIRRRPLGYQQLTVSNSAVSLTVPAGADYCVIEVSSNDVRYRDDGTNPTASVGMPLAAGAILTYDASPTNLVFIRSGSADATLDASYYD